MEQISGVVERITFSSEESGFSVIKIKSKGHSELVTVVGSLATVKVGSTVKLNGDWRTDTKYGKQFTVASFEELIPATLAGLEKYLGSGLIKGIGPEYAKKIVKTFKGDTMSVIEERPEDLIKVPGIGEKRVAMIIKAWAEQKEIKNLMIFLQAYNVSTHLAGKLYKFYGDDTIRIVKENPYRLADDIRGIGFRTADTIAKKLGIDPLSPARCRSGILYVMHELADEGHCYVTYIQLVEACEKLLELPEAIISEALMAMSVARDIILEQTDKAAGLKIKETSSAYNNKNMNSEDIEKAALWLPMYWYAETGAAARLLAILDKVSPYRTLDPEPILECAEEESGICYDEVQREAVRTAVQSKCMVLTGGPGTGKTTTTLAILRAFEGFDASVSLAAPTGRAAKRLSETTGKEAKTIHRLLEYKPPDGAAKNENNPLDCDVLVIDEASMVDILLFNALLKAVPDETVVLLVGDVDQLPSVGAGNVLHDIISSCSIPVVRLTRIFRQAADSSIILNAHRINKGERPTLKADKNSDFFFLEKEEPNEIAETIKDLCLKRLPARYGFHPINDIQVLCPMQRGETGAAAMNILLQAALNPSAISVKYAGSSYRIGDKVMQTRNNYDKNVFNGDVGFISEINREDSVVIIRYDASYVSYEFSELDEIMLAYATTVHKAQGSEYPVVVAPISTQHYMMLQRNLLYTCVTRAKRMLILVGTKKAIAMAVSNRRVRKRNTRLAERLSNSQRLAQ